MQGSHVYTLMLAMLLTLRATIPDEYVPVSYEGNAFTLSGMFLVSAVERFPSPKCHECIVRAIGISHILLLESNGVYNAY